VPNPGALFLLPSAVRRDPRVAAWFGEVTDPLSMMVEPWFDRLRGCGGDVRETLHDGMPTACVGDAAFAYVNAFSAHASIGFFHAADLPDPSSLLEGAGKRMRHVKLRLGAEANEEALRALIDAAYRDVRRRMESEE